MYYFKTATLEISSFEAGRREDNKITRLAGNTPRYGKLETYFNKLSKCLTRMIVRAWLNGNAMFYETCICFYVSEAKLLCFSVCSQMFDDVE